VGHSSALAAVGGLVKDVVGVELADVEGERCACFAFFEFVGGAVDI